MGRNKRWVRVEVRVTVEVSGDARGVEGVLDSRVEGSGYRVLVYLETRKKKSVGSGSRVDRNTVVVTSMELLSGWIYKLWFCI